MFKHDSERDKVIAAKFAEGKSAIAIAQELGLTKGGVYNALRRTGAPLIEQHSLTEEDLQAVIQRYQAGENVLAISRDFPQMSVTTIHNTLKRHGIETRSELVRKRLTPEQKESIVEDCLSGMIANAVAELHKVSPESVFNVLRARGIRLPKGRPRSCAVNDHAFDVLTPESEYWSGFLFADGNLHDDGLGAPAVTLALAEKDRDHVEKFRSFLGSTHTISQVTKPTGFGGGNVAYFRVRSRRLFDMLSSRGMTTSRTLAPSTELAASRHFWRGVVDGDGWLGIHPGEFIYPHIGLSGQIPLLEAFQHFLHTNKLAPLEYTKCEGAVWKMNTSGTTARIIAELLYTDARIALTRKLERARAIISGSKTPSSPYENEK